jgi:hypothetical protein
MAASTQEPWKGPLSDFMREIYWKRFRRERPDSVEAIEDKVKRERRKKGGKKIGQTDNSS